ncbi:MAG: hypothetical protein ABEJ08_02340 [Halobacteriaceae archaeon]
MRLGDWNFVAAVYRSSTLTEDDIEGAIARVLEAGFEPADEAAYHVEYSTDSGYDATREEAPPSEVAAETVADGHSEVVVSLDGFELMVDFELEKPQPEEPPVHLYGLEGALVGQEVSEDAARRRSDVLTDAVAELTTELDPWGVVTALHGEEGLHGEIPTDLTSDPTLSKLPWLTVFGPEWCDRLGGRARLLETPAYDARSLPNGAAMVRKTAVPDPEWSPTGVLDEKKAVSPTDYVFQDWTTTDPDELRERMLADSDREHLDPFRSFEAGAYGEDIVVCKAHCPVVGETDETDYRGLLDSDLDVGDRCQVLKVRRRDDKLWVQPSGEFLRRLVDVEGRPVGERPDGVPPEHEMLSLTVLLESQRENPPSWYAIEDTDDKSVATRVNRFISMPRSDSIWQDGNE